MLLSDVNMQNVYRPNSTGDALETVSEEYNLTVEGELDKLAANISIGRNMAGVHFYTDYYESLRLGERIAVSIIEEQMATYPEPVNMRFHSFDHDRMIVKGGGNQAIDVTIVDKGGQPISYGEWIQRTTNLVASS